MTIKKNLDAIIYEKLKDSLISGEYLSGQKIYIDELADRYGVSRTPVIQAVKRLGSEKILNVGQNGRVVVPEYSDKEIDDICQARLLVERFAIEQICQSRDDEIINRLEELAKECDNWFQKGDYVKSCKSDIAFHKCLVEGAGNSCVSDIFATVQGRFLIVSYLSLTSKERRQCMAASDHFALVKNLKAFDAVATCETMGRHIQSINDQIHEMRRRQEFVQPG